MTLVIDASVATKWVLPEIGVERAAALRETGESFIAPSLLVAELGSAVRKRARRGELTIEQAVRAVAVAAGLMTKLVPLEELSARATELSIQLDHPIYDCFYLALAERDDLELVTADEGMIASARTAKINVRRL